MKNRSTVIILSVQNHGSRPIIDIEFKTQHPRKILLCFWWDMKSTVYYGLLKLNQTIIAERYQQQLIMFWTRNVNNSLKKTQSDFVARQCSTKCCKSS